MTARPQIALQQHPLSAAFPSMSESDIEALAIDIQKHGQRERGVFLNGMILDGWHRYLACERVGVQFKAEEYEGDDPVSFVLSRNLHRRHLTASQRAAAIVTATNWKPLGANQHGGSEPGSYPPSMSEKQMAEAAEVSDRTIRQAKVAIEAGLGDAIKDGMVSAKEAAAIANGKTPKEPKSKKSEGVSPAEVAKLTARIETLTEEKNDLADTARELSDKLTAFETTDPDDQQKEIIKLQKKIVRLEAEIDRLTRARNDCQAKNNELIREVKRLRKRG